jgi:uncharacterized phage-associated protein
MAARLDSVAKFICQQSGWRVSNLALQKLLFLAQVDYAAANSGSRLTDTTFEAWDLGPVSPDLYHKVKIFGSQPVRDVFYDARHFREDDPRRRTLANVCRMYLGKRPGKLVEISHWDLGAWAKKYEPNVRGIAITDDDIRYEIRNRERHSDIWQRINAS